MEAVQRAAAQMCPLRLLLERVVVSDSGVVMACWQAAQGEEPVSMRQRLQVCVAAKNVRFLSLRTELIDQHRALHFLDIEAYMSKHTPVASPWSRSTYWM